MSSWYEDTELMHAFGQNWKNHKYIKKIGDRYFYTMDELHSYGQKAKRSAADMYGRVKKTVEDRTGVTARKKADNARKQASLYQTRANMAEARAKKLSSNMDENLRMQNQHRSNAAAIRKEVENSQDYKNAQMMKERASAANDREIYFTKKQNDPSADRAAKTYARSSASNARTEKEMFDNGAELYEKKLRPRLDAASAEDMKAERVRQAQIDTALKYSKNSKALMNAVDNYEDAIRKAQSFSDEYETSFAGKVEQARNDAIKAFDEVKSQASYYVDVGKNKINSVIKTANAKISDLADKADDTIAAGLGWVESIFNRKKK